MLPVVPCAAATIGQQRSARQADTRRVIDRFMCASLADPPRRGRRRGRGFGSTFARSALHCNDAGPGVKGKPPRQRASAGPRGSFEYSGNMKSNRYSLSPRLEPHLAPRWSPAAAGPAPAPRSSPGPCARTGSATSVRLPAPSARLDDPRRQPGRRKRLRVVVVDVEPEDRRRRMSHLQVPVVRHHEEGPAVLGIVIAVRPHACTSRPACACSAGTCRDRARRPSCAPGR